MELKENSVQVYCQFCGKRLPADILHVSGTVRLLVLCPKCKQKNIIERSGEK